jgi:hypothetical protein
MANKFKNLIFACGNFPKNTKSDFWKGVYIYVNLVNLRRTASSVQRSETHVHVSLIIGSIPPPAHPPGAGGEREGDRVVERRGEKTIFFSHILSIVKVVCVVLAGAEKKSVLRVLDR